MKCWFVLILFGSLLVHVISRPPPEDYNNENDEEEIEEDENDQATDDLSSEDNDSGLIDQNQPVQDGVSQNRPESRYIERNAAEDRPNNLKTDFSDSKYSRTLGSREDNPLTNYDEQLRSMPKRRQMNRYGTGNDEKPDLEQLQSDREQNQEDVQVNKRTVAKSSEDGDAIFEKNRDGIDKVGGNAYNNNDMSDPSEQSRFSKQYYNTMHSDNRETVDDKSHDNARYYLRDRRDAKDGVTENETTSTAINQKSKENEETKSDVDEETVIKTHVKKLSENELNDLLNSLSPDKRDLLKKIISDSEIRDDGLVDKREITKKAQAVDENNIIENIQSDLSKLQGGNLSPEETTETNFPHSKIDSSSESVGVSTTLTDSTINSLNKVEAANTNDQSDLAKSDNVNVDSKTQSEIVAKRQANLDDFQDSELDKSGPCGKLANDQSNADYSNDQGYYSLDESSIDDDAQINDESKGFKREVLSGDQPEISDTMKSLGESFPNSEDVDETGSYSAPLVRVKRRNVNQQMKKRSADVPTDTKVAYIPYKAENEDEDNDEGNEFEDEGFFDRTSNYANNNKVEEEDSDANIDNSVIDKADNSEPSNENPERDAVSLGSDSDSVLSGVEGVDDNLMFSGPRSRRTVKDNTNEESINKSDPAQSLTDNESKLESEKFNAPNYQENDAFGPLSRNYEGDLGRYKRIRRVKQSHNTQEDPSSDG